MKNKTKFLILYSLLFVLCEGVARADVIDFYVGGVAGAGAVYSNISNSSDSLKNHFSTMSYGGMFGIDIPVIRAEAEYNYLTGTRGGNTFNKNIGMLNGYIKFLPTPIIKPYIGAGIGVAFGGKISGALNANLKSDAAYAGMIGVQVKIPATSIFVDVEGRVLYAPNAFPGNTNMLMPEARVKLRYLF